MFALFSASLNRAFVLGNQLGMHVEVSTRVIISEITERRHLLLV